MTQTRFKWQPMEKNVQKLSVSISNWIYVGLKYLYSLVVVASFLSFHFVSHRFDGKYGELNVKPMQWNSFHLRSNVNGEKSISIFYAVALMSKAKLLLVLLLRLWLLLPKCYLLE